MYRLLDWRRFLVADKFVSQRSIPQAIYRFPSCVHHISNMEHFRNLPEASAYQPPHLGSGDLAKSPNSAPRGLRVEPGMYEQQSRGCGRCCDEGRHRMVVETSGDTRKVASPASHSSDIWPECLRINLFAKPLLLFFITIIVVFTLDCGRDARRRQEGFCVWMHTCIFSFFSIPLLPACT